jgi:hypothetical protein
MAQFGFKTINDYGELQIDEVNRNVPAAYEGNLPRTDLVDYRGTLEITTGVFSRTFPTVPLMFVRPTTWSIPGGGTALSGSIGGFTCEGVGTNTLVLGWWADRQFEYKICTMHGLTAPGGTNFGMKILDGGTWDPSAAASIQREVFDSRRKYPRVRQRQRYYYGSGWARDDYVTGNIGDYVNPLPLTDWNDYTNPSWPKGYGALGDYPENTFFYPTRPWVLLNPFTHSEHALTNAGSTDRYTFQITGSTVSNTPLEMHIGMTNPANAPIVNPILTLLAVFD